MSPTRPVSPKRRRSLTHVGGEVETTGNREVAAALAHALTVSPPADEADGDDPDRAHVHGFHTYPARMHPTTAARLVRTLSAERATVLDPFCGSGTVLVETMIAGRAAVGTDLNPLAVRLARLKTPGADLWADARRAALVAAAREVAAFADARRERRAGATRRYPPEDVALFDPHVLLELDSLRAAIAVAGQGEGADENVHDALELVLSSILVKVSRRTSDTSPELAQRRIAAGFPARLFVRKTEELARRLAEFAALLPHGAGPARVAIDDAARLRTIAASTVDAVVTSPPYVATYDYLAHHALRMRWLGLEGSAAARELVANEIGARRRYANMQPREAREAWTRELSRTLRAISRVCKGGARVALVLADSAVRGEALRADAIVAEVAPEAGFAPLARASQRRPHFHAPTSGAFERNPRAEHAIALEKRGRARS
jgi:hypothetical protein